MSEADLRQRPRRCHPAVEPPDEVIIDDGLVHPDHDIGSNVTTGKPGEKPDERD